MTVHRPVWIALVLAVSVLFPRPATAQKPPESHLDLDWSAPLRWVHVDNIDPARAPLFESSRRGWLAALRQGDHLLGDGRPLFWHAGSGAVQTYFTLYPFRKWTDLDLRADMVGRTNKSVGDDAVKTYDRGDSALVSPHYSQIWRRIPDYDITWEGTDSLTELTGVTGRLEVHGYDLRRNAEFDSLWGEMRKALVARRYPLACRMYGTVYGKGEYMLLWMGPDSGSYAAAPSLPSVLIQEMGEARSREILAAMLEVFPLRESYEVTRRADLSNMGRGQRQ